MVIVTVRTPPGASGGRARHPEIDDVALDRGSHVRSDRTAVAGDEHPGSERDHGRVDGDHADPDRQPARRAAGQVIGDRVDDERPRPRARGRRGRRLRVGCGRRVADGRRGASIRRAARSASRDSASRRAGVRPCLRCSATIVVRFRAVAARSRVAVASARLRTAARAACVRVRPASCASSARVRRRASTASSRLRRVACSRPSSPSSTAPSERAPKITSMAPASPSTYRRRRRVPMRSCVAASEPRAIADRPSRRLRVSASARSRSACRSASACARASATSEREQLDHRCPLGRGERRELSGTARSAERETGCRQENERRKARRDVSRARVQGPGTVPQAG